MSRYTDERVPLDVDAEVRAQVEIETGERETYAMPATQGQLRFWSLDQLNPGNPALNMPLMWRFTGPVDVDALRQAFTRTIERHESLRTTFALLDGHLSQIVRPPFPADLPVVDLESFRGDISAEADRLTRAHAALRMDLKAGPLLALKLLRFDATHRLLLVTMHHIVCDGISNGILLRDMAAFYEELVAGRPARLPELPIQFADFAVWQNEWLAGPRPAESLDFWKRSLGDDFSPLELPRDSDALSTLDERRDQWTGDIETLLIPHELQARAHAFCARANITLNILLFSIFVALMRALTGQRDLLIGSPCANRTDQTEDLIGLFMNIQVMRLKLREDETFRELLAQVQAWTLGAYEHQEFPFETLVHDAGMVSNRSFELPIFFLYQRSFMVTHTIGSLEIVPLRSESPGAVFEIMFAIVDRVEEGPRLQLEYNPRYFKASTIQRYLRTYICLLESALSAPETRVDDLAVMPPEERRHLLTATNDTAVDLGPYEAVATTIARWAERNPDRVAVTSGGSSLTYEELLRQARAIAAAIRAERLGPGELVGLWIERSTTMISALLGTLLSGCAYVPLDPRHPQERLRVILADAGIGMLLTGGDAVPPETNTRTRVVEEILESPPAQVADASPAADALAYVIYTSGSTGAPKGVAIEQGALFNLLRSMEREPGLQSGDTMVALATLAFDMAVPELLLPLMTGAHLVVATHTEVRDGRQLLHLLERHRAPAPFDTVLQATPGAWRILIDAGWSDSLPLKALCGAEALPRELAEDILDRARVLWNMYGPTETTVWSSATRVERGSGTLRLGRPIANTRFHVLDERHHLVPAGVGGELHIAGAGLARGYWQRPALTDEKFFSATLSEGGNPERLYATGDLARRHEDGTLELLGRTDFQVKIRGYRIELAEIEGALCQHPLVTEAVLTQRKSDETSATSLVAYVAGGTLTAEESERLIGELKASLAERLPEYMLPNAYVTLPALPRNPNGKIDRKALPSVTSPSDGVHSTAAQPEEFVEPADSIERQVADIWQTTLGVPRISTQASFFSLGVGSLAALRLITKLNRIYAMDLGLASLISASTIASIAGLIRERFAPNTDSSVVPLQPHGSHLPLYIVHGVGGNVVNFYGLAMRMGRDQPVYGIQAQALVANQPALLRLKDMAAHYIADVRARQPHGPYRLLGYSFGGTVVLEMAHQLRAAGEEVEMLGMIDSKSRDYEEMLARMSSVPRRITHRVSRFRGNTLMLDWRARIRYVADKINTRAIRFACRIAAGLHFTQVPAFMRSAYDINYNAVQTYRPQPYEGKLVLFRASEQDMRGPYDLGWGSLFSEGVEVHEMPGDHERIFLEPNIDRLAAGLREALLVSSGQLA